jgi:hypothetical protein
VACGRDLARAASIPQAATTQKPLDPCLSNLALSPGPELRHAPASQCIEAAAVDLYVHSSVVTMMRHAIEG